MRQVDITSSNEKMDRKTSGKYLFIVGFPIAFVLYGLNPEYLFKLLRFNSEFLRIML